ncbi:MAG: complement resistance protein TraT [Nitrospirota bacterium]|nr:complement resistance protein TraT [Nitrospirota bacterium]
MHIHSFPVHSRALTGAALVLLIAGCAAVDTAYIGTVGAVDPDKLRLKQETKWLNPQPNLRLVGEKQMVVMLRVRDSSGTGIEITNDLRDALLERGYRVTGNLDDAQYVMNLDLRYYGENATADGGRASMAAGVGGAIAGGVIGHQSHRTGSGAMVGAVAASMLFDVAAQRNKIREYDVVMDVRVGERVEGGVHTTRTTGEDTSVRHSGTFRSGGIESGRGSGGSGETQVYETTEDFLYHQNRLVVFTSRMNLSPEEAQPVLHQRLIRALANTLP